MCGIAGYAMSSREIPEAAFEGVRRMLHHMRRRGPDADGVWSEHGVVLGHRRLAILDLAARANQPMRSHDQRYAIVFNGEIYNFRDLRRTLERQNVAFHTSSDTEVLLELFAREGPAMLKRLRGMFSLAIWDSRERELFLARDPYGIKPLYYTQTGDGFLFASQVKALLASRNRGRSIATSSRYRLGTACACGTARLERRPVGTTSGCTGKALQALLPAKSSLRSSGTP